MGKQSSCMLVHVFYNHQSLIFVTCVVVRITGGGLGHYGCTGVFMDGNCTDGCGCLPYLGAAEKVHEVQEDSDSVMPDTRPRTRVPVRQL